MADWADVLQQLYANAKGMKEVPNATLKSGPSYVPNWTQGAQPANPMTQLMVPEPPGISIGGAAPAEQVLPEVENVVKAGKLGKLAKLGKLGSKTLPPLAIALEVLAGIKGVNAASGTVDPNGTGLEKLAAMFAGGENDPERSGFANDALHFLGGIGKSNVDMMDSVGGAFSGISNYFGGKQGAGAPAPIAGPKPVNAFDAVAELLAGQGSDGIPYNPNIPPSPEIPTPGGVDLSGAMKWLDQAKPTAQSPEESDKLSQLNLIAGLAQGLGNVDQTKGVGAMLAQLGAGAGMGMLRGALGQADQQKRDVAAQADYAKMRAGFAVDMAKMDAEHQNSVAEIAFKNAMLKHADALKQIELEQPQFLGLKGGQAIYQIRDPKTQTIQIKAFNTGLLGQRDIAEGMANQTTGGNSDVSDFMAADQVPFNDAFGFYMNIAKDLSNRGVLSTVLQGAVGPDGKPLYEGIDTAAKTLAMSAPGEEKMKGRMYNQYLIGNVAGAMMNDSNLITAASPYSLYARGLQQLLFPEQQVTANGQ